MFEILRELIREEYQVYFKDWEETAYPNEKCGLQLLHSIYASKGLMKVDRTVTEPKLDVKSLYFSQFDYKKSEQFLNEKINTTHYQKEFGQLAGADPHNLIFKYMQISEVDFCK